MFRRSTKDWTADWRGRRIVVRCAKTILRSEESLSIDGAVVARHGAWLPFGILLQAPLSVEGGIHIISAEIAPVRSSAFGVGCHIFADGQLIGGDIGVDLVHDVHY